jgi:quinol monooxygenase YgiN
MNTWMTSIQIKTSLVESFVTVTAPFAAECLREPGLVSFALLQKVDQPGSFSLFEVYHDEQARQAHLTAQYFCQWREAISPLLEEEFWPEAYLPIHPPPEDWERHLEV